MIASLCGLIPFVGLAGAIAGIVMGFIARRQIRESGGTQGGEGMALAGIIIGIALLAIEVLIVVAVLVGANHVSHCQTLPKGTLSCP